MQNLFDLLSARFASAAQSAAALGLSRQAFQQASARRRLSDRAAIRAAALLYIDPGRALLINATGQDPAPPIPHPAAHPCPEPIQPAALALHYVKSASNKVCCTDDSKKNRDTVHSITSKSQNDAVDLIRWCLAVTRLPADSPRFAWYVSRWLVPEKIAAAKKAGTFSATVANCPPIDPAWVRFVPAALEAYKAFTAPRRPIAERPQYSGKKSRAA
ncbi:MAG: hypothetical protein ACOYB3_07285 [Azonexus sp.]